MSSGELLKSYTTQHDKFSMRVYQLYHGLCLFCTRYFGHDFNNMTAAYFLNISLENTLVDMFYFRYNVLPI